jgi:hypothetical protein
MSLPPDPHGPPPDSAVSTELNGVLPTNARPFRSIDSDTRYVPDGKNTTSPTPTASRAARTADVSSVSPSPAAPWAVTSA